MSNALTLTPDQIQAIIDQNIKLKAERDDLARFIKPPAPVYPDLALPQPPKVHGHEFKDTLRPDGEGSFNPILSPTSPVPPPPEGKARILVGIPMLAITYEFFESFLRFWGELQAAAANSPYEIGYHFAYRKPVHMAEEYLVSVAQHNKCTHILLMDDDIYDITKAHLDLLFNADKDVIGGVMHASKFPHAMCVFRRYNTDLKVIDMPSDTSIYRLYEVPCHCPECKTTLSHWDMKHCYACGKPVNNLIQQADLIPFAFTLIKMSVFDKINKPWFHCTNQYPTDSWFADRLIEAGLTEHAHMAVRLNHAGVNDYTKPFYIQMGMAKARQADAVVELTPEQLELHQNLLLNKMREVEFTQKPKPQFHASEGTIVNKSDKPGKDVTLVTHGR